MSCRRNATFIRMPARVFTVGHSTRSVDDLINLLQDHAVTLLVDVRTLPGSRRMPHFNKEQLQPALTVCDIAYEHLKELGGLRKPRPDSSNLAWRNISF